MRLSTWEAKWGLVNVSQWPLHPGLLLSIGPCENWAPSGLKEMGMPPNHPELDQGLKPMTWGSATEKTAAIRASALGRSQRGPGQCQVALGADFGLGRSTLSWQAKTTRISSTSKAPRLGQAGASENALSDLSFLRGNVVRADRIIVAARRDGMMYPDSRF